MCLFHDGHVRLLLRILILLLPLFVTTASAAGANRHGIDFSGHWELDYQMSDFPSEKIRWEYTRIRAQVEKMIERSDRPINPAALNVESIVGLGRLTEKIAQATVLDVEQQDDYIVVNRNDDFALVCDFANAAPLVSAVGAESCEWDEDQLVFNLTLPDGLRVSHRLSLAADRSRMNVATTVKVIGLPYPFTLNRVYQPFEPGEGMYQCEFTIATQTTCTLGGSESP